MSTWLLSLALLQTPQAPAATPPDAPPAAPPAAAAAIQWQRTLADALAVQRATGKPLLVCVNTDGEMFCDRFAATTYVDPAFVATTRGWVCVVASPDRHTQTDYDGMGRRIECPRFPGCTCSEHIQIEPELYRRWFKDQRYAPRHVGVAPDGTVLFDHFLDRDMQSAIGDIEKHAGSRDEAPAQGDTAQLLQRRDAAARRRLEAAYEAADRDGRLAILRAAKAADSEPFDLLRRALRDDDAAVFGAAVAALGAVATPAAAIDVQDALARCTAEQEPELLAACSRLAGGAAPDALSAQFLAHRKAAQAGLARAARAPFANVHGVPAPTPDDRGVVEAALDVAERAAKAAPDDAAAQLRLAQANLDLAWFLLPSGDGTVPLWFEDARRAAARAAAAGDAGVRAAAEAVVAIALRQQGNNAEARAHAGAALAALEAAGEGFDASPRWVAELLGAAARGAAAAAYAAVQQDATASAEQAVGEAAFAFAALQAHPKATSGDAREGADLLAFAGLRPDALRLLRTGLGRWPGDRELHDAWRRRVLADRGTEALRAEYAAFVANAADVPTAQWFAGYAELVAAELHVTDRRHAEAAAAYGGCIERMQASAAGNPDFADSANHFAVLARAGRALERHLAGDAEGAVADLLAAVALRPASMTERDGLERTPDGILRRIARELREQGKGELAARLPQG